MISPVLNPFYSELEQGLIKDVSAMPGIKIRLNYSLYELYLIHERIKNENSVSNISLFNFL
jgi:hypothetical protein